jgi:hypothetical protein
VAHLLCFEILETQKINKDFCACFHVCEILLVSIVLGENLTTHNNITLLAMKGIHNNCTHQKRNVLKLHLNPFERSNVKSWKLAILGNY